MPFKKASILSRMRSKFFGIEQRLLGLLCAAVDVDSDIYKWKARDSKLSRTHSEESSCPVGIYRQSPEIKSELIQVFKSFMQTERTSSLS